MKQALLIHLQDGGLHIGGDAFHLAADHVQHLGQGALAGHGLQHLVLQGLVHLGAGDVGEDGDGVAPLAIRPHHRIADDLGPVALALLAADDLLAAHGTAGAQRRAVLVHELLGELGRQQGDRRLADGLLGRPAEHAAEAGVDIDDARLGVADQDGAVAGIGHQGQALQMLLLGALMLQALAHIAGHLEHLDHAALRVAHGV